MTNQPVRGKTPALPSITRRTLLAAAPAAGIAVMATSSEGMTPTPSSDDPNQRQRLLDVINALEDANPYEMHLSIAAKAFAANEIRKAMDLPLRNEALVQEYNDATAIFIANGEKTYLKGGAA